VECSGSIKHLNDERVKANLPQRWYIDHKFRKEENEDWNPKTYPPREKPRRRATALTNEIAPAFQTRREDVANRCVPYMINWTVITRTTSIPITSAPTGDASNATSPRKIMSEMEDTSMQKVGMRDDREKETYDPYISRERYYEQLYISVRGGGRECTHNESLQVDPIITE
jgi:hypothetical protein